MEPNLQCSKQVPNYIGTNWKIVWWWVLGKTGLSQQGNIIDVSGVIIRSTTEGLIFATTTQQNPIKIAIPYVRHYLSINWHFKLILFKFSTTLIIPVNMNMTYTKKTVILTMILLLLELSVVLQNAVLSAILFVVFDYMFNNTVEACSDLTMIAHLLEIANLLLRPSKSQIVCLIFTMAKKYH